MTPEIAIPQLSKNRAIRADCSHCKWKVKQGLQLNGLMLNFELISGKTSDKRSPNIREKSVLK